MKSKSECQCTLHRARIQFSQHLEQELKYVNSKQWWKFVKSVTDSNKTSAVPPLKSDNGQIFNDAEDKAELLNNTFAANAHLDDKGKVPPKPKIKTDETISTIRFWPSQLWYSRTVRQSLHLSFQSFSRYP